MGKPVRAIQSDSSNECKYRNVYLYIYICNICAYSYMSQRQGSNGSGETRASSVVKCELISDQSVSWHNLRKPGKTSSFLPRGQVPSLPFWTVDLKVPVIRQTKNWLPLRNEDLQYLRHFAEAALCSNHGDAQEIKNMMLLGPLWKKSSPCCYQLA